MDGLKKSALSLGIAILMLAPLWIFLACNNYLEPVTFFEKAAMIVLGYVFLGGAQIWALIIGVAAIISVWME